MKKKIKRQFEAEQDAVNLKESAELLYGQALLLESSPLPDPASFARLVANLMG